MMTAIVASPVRVECFSAIAIGAPSGEFNAANAVEQAEQCLKNLSAIAEAAGTELSETVKTPVLPTDLADFAGINRVYGGFLSRPLSGPDLL